MKVTATVPATTANLGSGFDCIGVALGLYNKVSAEEIPSGLEIIIEDGAKDIPTDESNLIYRSMKLLFDKAGYHPGGIRMTQTNNIPMTRGLGSSSASIVGGLYCANALCGNRFTNEEIMLLANEIEGHPDNVVPAICGGIAVSVVEGDKVFYVKHGVSQNLTFAVVVPDFHLATKTSRRVLPQTVGHSDATYNIGRSALLISSFATGKYENLKCALGDKIHQQYRMGLIDGAEKVFAKMEELGTLGTYISGAGPSLVSLISGNEEEFERKMREYLNKNFCSWQLYMLKVDNCGVSIITQ